MAKGQGRWTQKSEVESPAVIRVMCEYLYECEYMCVAWELTVQDRDKWVLLNRSPPSDQLRLRSGRIGESTIQGDQVGVEELRFYLCVI